MTSRSLSQRQLSRSKLSLFLECPRCFYEEVVRGIGRVPSFPLSLNNAVDHLLKAEFDVHRAAGTSHPLFATVGLDAVPFTHARLDEWRKNFTGVRWTDTESGWTLFGAIDDVWVTPTGSVIVVDYKATARQGEVTAANIYDSYQRQVEVYQFLLGKQGLTVEPRAWFLYANGIAADRSFGGVLSFRETLLPYDGNHDWVLGTFRDAVALATGGIRPAAAKDCKWCRYVEERGAAA